MDSAPGIPTDNGEYEYMPDTQTQLLNIQLNSVEVIDQVPIYRRGDRLASPDREFNVGYKQVGVDNQVSKLPYHFEAPEVPVQQLPYKENLFNSTLVQKQIGDEIVFKKSFRAPGINEGY